MSKKSETECKLTDRPSVPATVMGCASPVCCSVSSCSMSWTSWRVTSSMLMRSPLRNTTPFEYHTVTYTGSRDGRLGSDCDGLPLLFGHHDLPILRVVNSYRAKIGLEHVLARENTFQ